jgi:hypothetical protein
MVIIVGGRGKRLDRCPVGREVPPPAEPAQCSRIVSRRSENRRRWAEPLDDRPSRPEIFALALGALLIGLATLWPLPALEPTEGTRGIRLDVQPADLARNLLLFAPLGALMFRQPATLSLLATAAFSLSIELIQGWLPGRVVSPWDVAANVSGVWIGWAVGRSVQRRGWLDPVLMRRAHVAWSLLVGSMLITTALLFRPAIPDPPYFAQRNPSVGDLEPYAGAVESVWLDDRAVPHGRVTIDDFATRIMGPHVLVVHGRVGSPPSRIASPLIFTDESGTEVAILAVRGDDVFYRVSTIGMQLGFDHPFMWWRDALAPLRPGSELDVRVERTPDSLCLEIAGSLRCGLAPSLSDGWQNWFPAGRLGTIGQRVFEGLWFAALFLPLGFGLRRRPVEVLSVLGVFVLALLLPWVGPVESIGPATIAAILGWLSLGALLRAALTGRQPAQSVGRNL